MAPFSHLHSVKMELAISASHSFAILLPGNYTEEENKQAGVEMRLILNGDSDDLTLENVYRPRGGEHVKNRCVKHLAAPAAAARSLERCRLENKIK